MTISVRPSLVTRRPPVEEGSGRPVAWNLIEATQPKAPPPEWAQEEASHPSRLARPTLEGAGLLVEKVDHGGLAYDGLRRVVGLRETMFLGGAKPRLQIGAEMTGPLDDPMTDT